MKEFRDYNLSDKIIKSLELLGYIKPTKVQEAVIPLALEKKDLVVKSQTGSGKTAAFGIPICDIIDENSREPQALILTPTRELCVQVKEDITNIGRFKRIRCAAIFGKQPITIQKNELKQRVHIIVGTPGRTMDHIKKENLNLSGLKYLIVDEADKMLNMGFIDQVEEIISFLPKERITMLFSATMPEEIEQLCNKYMKIYERIEVTPEKLTTDKIKQEYYKAEDMGKLDLLTKIIYIENPESCIIFCNTKDNVDWLRSKMKGKGFSCDALHGGMYQENRLDIMKRFKNGEFRILIATDVAARGIDVENLTHAINYDVPEEKESYVHRIGRTGRAGKSGKAITLLYNREIKFFKEIEELIGERITEKKIPTKEELEKAIKTFNTKGEEKPKRKISKSEAINKEITKLYFGAGKKKKIRAGDIVGVITSIEGIKGEDVGIIDLQDNFAYVDILNKKGDIVLDALSDITIKGKKVKIEKAIK